MSVYDTAQVTHEVQICVTHWKIYRAWRLEPYAAFGFALCPIEEGQEHEVMNFAAFNDLVVGSTEEQ